MRPCSATWWCCRDIEPSKSQKTEAQNLWTLKSFERDGLGLNPILQVRKVRLKEVKQLTQSHTARLPGLFPHCPTPNIFIASSPPTQVMNERMNNNTNDINDKKKKLRLLLFLSCWNGINVCPKQSPPHKHRPHTTPLFSIFTVNFLVSRLSSLC